jgi:GTPase Era involved in 16S rRNA processing
MNLWAEVEEITDKLKSEKKPTDIDNLWDEVEVGDLEETLEEDIHDNKYLSNPIKALDLITNLYRKSSKPGNVSKLSRRLEKLIHEQYVSTTGALHFKDEGLTYQDLHVLKDKINLPNSLQTLLNKNIVAIAGGFSAGKSTFINSLLDYSLLPQDQTPTTAVATYISNGPFEIRAITDQLCEAQLDMDAFKAISHMFYQRYQVDLPAYIDRVVVKVPSLIYENITIIDTPGYTKADGFKEASQTDRQIAKQQLRMADYLIWLVDIDNGTIKEEDLKFISDVNFIKPILIIFNQADKKPQPYIEQTIEKAYEAIRHKGLTNVYAITAYSSFDKKEYTGNYILEFLKECNQSDTRNLIKEPFQKLEESIRAELSELEAFKKDMTESIYQASGLNHVATLLPLRLHQEIRVQKLTEVQHQVLQMKEKLNSIMKKKAIHMEEGSHNG